MHRTLQERCEVGVAIDICNDPEVKDIMFATSKHLMEFSSESNNTEELEKWHSTFLTEISQILKDFPCWLLGKIKYLIPLISVEMIKWARFHKETFFLSIEFCKGFISRSLFTSTGAIDREKAARALMEDVSLRPSTRFRIGSYYALSDEALKFWTEVPDFEVSSLRFGNTIAVLWAEFLMGHNKGTNFTYDVLKAAVDSGSELSFCCYWKKIDEGSKEEVANYFAQTFLQKLKLWKKNRKSVDFLYLCEPYIDMFEFLLKDLGLEKIKTLLNEHGLTYWVLTYMLHWPYHSSFLGTIKSVWGNLSKQAFYCLLLDIIVKIEDPFVAKLYDYRDLFRKIWKESPENFKMSLFWDQVTYANNDVSVDFDFYFGKDAKVTQASYGYLLLLKLFNLNFGDVDEQNVRLLFENIEVSELRIMEFNFGDEIRKRAIKKGNFRCVDLFINCCKVLDLDDFKRDLNNTEFQTILSDLLVESKFADIDQILIWSLGGKDFQIFKQKLSALMSTNLSLNIKVNSIKIQSEESEFKKALDINGEHFVRNLKVWLLGEKFGKANEFLKWVFPSVKELHDYKKALSKKHTKNYEMGSEWAALKFELRILEKEELEKLLAKCIYIFCRDYQ